MTKPAFVIVLLLLFPIIATYSTEKIKASDNIIYIRADGSIDPPTAPIQTLDNVTYTLAGNVSESIVIERNDTVLNGLGFVVGNARISIARTSNVTIKNMITDSTTILFLDADKSTLTENNMTFNSNPCGRGSYIVLASSEYNDISENAIVGTGPYEDYSPLYVEGSANNTISENNITVDWGTGIYLMGSSDNHIDDNRIEGRGYGIRLENSCNNNLSGNVITVNSYIGCSLLWRSFNNILRTNRFINCSYGFAVFGENIAQFTNDMDSSNTIDGKPVYYWINKSCETIPSDAGCVILVNCSGIKVENLELRRNYCGITLAYSDNCTVSRNHLSDSRYGIVATASFKNEICENTIESNTHGLWLYPYCNFTNINDNRIRDTAWDGIKLTDSSNINLYGNTITNATNGISSYSDMGFGFNINIIGNNISSNSQSGMILQSTNSTIEGNTLAHNHVGISLDGGTNHIVYGNLIEKNYCGVEAHSSGSRIFHNNLVNNTIQGAVIGKTNTWDDNYPSGGNYWSDYIGEDGFSGDFQNRTGSDGVGDKPYIIDYQNVDRFPLMIPFDPQTDAAVRSFRILLSMYNQVLSDLEKLNSTLKDLISNNTYMQATNDYFNTSLAEMQEQLVSLSTMLNDTAANLLQNTTSLDSAHKESQERLDTLMSDLLQFNDYVNDHIQSLETNLGLVINVTFPLMSTALTIAVTALAFALRQKKTRDAKEENQVEAQTNQKP